MSGTDVKDRVLDSGKDQVFFLSAVDVKQAGQMMEEGQEKRREVTPLTIPFDARFPNQNQSKNCWQNYIDYHRCIYKKGEDFQPCLFFKKVYSSVCINADIEAWDDALAEGNFPGDYKN